ncbi:NAD(P)-binding domain-containing protein [Pedobacter sp. HDW13]|uniref:NADPH-dependent F420 reductase n=1 Tax=unclassified Pedobacter TaxID=2628915 RepID=UPI000F5A9C0D|nr:MULTISPECIES: NAD(P)-binding domain-containing protein [unclassified Pedobacter]QIL37920.1 NAD(P)-binding domain-containing protein [Pedobacter sp. HDW13]RQO68921.1 NADP oxidoreductase [Pedobacter sp. KBW01]
MKKSIGIIGAGNIGKAVAGHFTKAGFPVLISNSQAPESLAATTAFLGQGVKAVTPAEAAKADIVILALPWSEVLGLSGLTDWDGRIVVDATNHFITYAPDFQVAYLDGLASSEVVQQHLSGARIVKAFNTIFFKILEQDPHVENGNRVLFVSGDDQQAKEIVSQAISEIGFAPIDLGSLAVGSKFQQAKGALATLNLVKIS